MGDTGRTAPDELRRGFSFPPPGETAQTVEVLQVNNNKQGVECVSLLRE